MTRRIPGWTVLSSATIAGCLALMVTTMPAVAQEDTAAAVHGSIDECVTVVVGSDDTGPGGSAMTSGQVWQCQGSSDDERLTGTIEVLFNIARWTDVGAIQWGYARISNDEGSWSGTWSSNVQADGEQVILAWYVGEGAYEGWSYVETQQGDYQQPREVFGIAYPGVPPPNVSIELPAEMSLQDPE